MREGDSFFRVQVLYFREQGVDNLPGFLSMNNAETGYK